MYLLGFDIGSSSVKAALVHVSKGTITVQKSPEVEMEIISSESGWAEQDPKIWWQNLKKATQSVLKESQISPADISAIGISYQMHGLVMVDNNKDLIRNSIIWCDSRAVAYGAQAFKSIGEEYCLSNWLNSPGNFTASKLMWVKENEPEIFEKCYKILLPGDYINLRLTGELQTTVTGLSEGVLWNFKNHEPAYQLLEHYGFDKSLLADIVENFSVQARLGESAAAELNLKANIPICYRAGDQANNAMSLGVSLPGEVAATGGTSGVIYGILDEFSYDQLSRVNGFAHVNHSLKVPRIGQLLCINGAGILYAWLRRYISKGNSSYKALEIQAQSIPVGAEGLCFIPFGNGAERMLENRNLGAQLLGLEFNRHTDSHIYRAALEGIAFAFFYGFKILSSLGLKSELIKVGNDNLFRSKIFSQTLANLTGSQISVIDTTGAIGAAKGAGLGIGLYSDLEEAFGTQASILTYIPEKETENYLVAYNSWERKLEKLVDQKNICQ